MACRISVTSSRRIGPAAATFSQHFHDADAYVLDLLRLVPNSLAKHFAPLPETRGLSSLRDLLRATFEGRDPRARYEAQRKLYLAKMLFDIDHCRSIRDGLRHRDYFESDPPGTIWRGAEDGGETEICAALSNHGGDQQFAVGVPPTPQARCWKFRLRRLKATPSEAAVDVYH